MLKDDAVRSAQIYLDYLVAHRDEGLGLVRARVRSVQGSLLDGEMALFTDRVIRSGEGLVVRIGGTVYENTANVTHFRVMSIARRKVTIAPSPELAEHIESAVESREAVYLEADLTFLVKRVMEWYKAYGDRVELFSSVSGCPLDPENPIALSENQYDCAALAMSSPLAYIWGAPGTGKTRHVLASCVLSYIRAGKKVILVAPTNNALEQSLQGLLRALSDMGGIDPAGKVIRLGVPGDIFRMVWPDICEEGALNRLRSEVSEKISALQYRNARIDASLAVREGKGREGAEDAFPDKSGKELKAEKKKNTAVLNGLLSKSRKLTEKGIMGALEQFSVVAATVDTCLYKISPESAFKPDHIFLDEAGFCNVIKGMTLLGFGKPLTLLGDHMQLPPVFEGEQELLRDPEKQLARLWKISSLYMENVVLCEDLHAFCRQDPDRPVFQRMQVGSLTETHRFGPELAAVLAKRIYGPRFCSRSEGETKILFVNAPKKAADREKDEDGKHRRVSHSEAACIRTLMENNLSHLNVTMGIITPYRRQRRLLSDTMDRLLKKHRMEDEDMEDDIVTVHQSQGREWDIVLFSVTDAFDEKHFTDTVRNPQAMKLINTAVSRAKKMLVIVGDAEDWKGKTGQLVSELFAVGTEIDPQEKIVRMVQPEEKGREFVPWEDNYGSLYMALSVEE